MLIILKKSRSGLRISNHNPKQQQLNFIALLKVNERKHVFKLQIQHKTHVMNILGLDICRNEPKRPRKK